VTATPVGPIILSLVGLLTLTLGAALGGELVYRHGRRVELDPTPAVQALEVQPSEPPAADPDRPSTAG
jgi:uncharacterized membrane protein